ncbi:MAG: hypothetical protein ACK4NC_06885 [Candidatus Gracilibacteria bacterium]
MNEHDKGIKISEISKDSLEKTVVGNKKIRTLILLIKEAIEKVEENKQTQKKLIKDFSVMNVEKSVKRMNKTFKTELINQQEAQKFQSAFDSYLSNDIDEQGHMTHLREVIAKYVSKLQNEIGEVSLDVFLWIIEKIQDLDLSKESIKDIYSIYSSTHIKKDIILQKQEKTKDSSQLEIKMPRQQKLRDILGDKSDEPFTLNHTDLKDHTGRTLGVTLKTLTHHEIFYPTDKAPSLYYKCSRKQIDQLYVFCDLMVNQIKKIDLTNLTYLSLTEKFSQMLTDISYENITKFSEIIPIIELFEKYGPENFAASISGLIRSDTFHSPTVEPIIAFIKTDLLHHRDLDDVLVSPFEYTTIRNLHLKEQLPLKKIQYRINQDFHLNTEYRSLNDIKSIIDDTGEFKMFIDETYSNYIEQDLNKDDSTFFDIQKKSVCRSAAKINEQMNLIKTINTAENSQEIDKMLKQISREVVQLEILRDEVTDELSKRSDNTILQSTIENVLQDYKKAPEDTEDTTLANTETAKEEEILAEPINNVTVIPENMPKTDISESTSLDTVSEVKAVQTPELEEKIQKEITDAVKRILEFYPRPLSQTAIAPEPQPEKKFTPQEVVFGNVTSANSSIFGKVSVVPEIVLKEKVIKKEFTPQEVVMGKMTSGTSTMFGKVSVLPEIVLKEKITEAVAPTELTQAEKLFSAQPGLLENLLNIRTSLRDNLFTQWDAVEKEYTTIEKQIRFLLGKLETVSSKFVALQEVAVTLERGKTNLGQYYDFIKSAVIMVVGGEKTITSFDTNDEGIKWRNISTAKQLEMKKVFEGEHEAFYVYLKDFHELTEAFNEAQQIIYSTGRVLSELEAKLLPLSRNKSQDYKIMLNGLNPSLLFSAEELELFSEINDKVSEYIIRQKNLLRTAGTYITEAQPISKNVLSTHLSERVQLSEKIDLLLNWPKVYE